MCLGRAATYQRDQVRQSAVALENDVRQWIDNWNQDPKPFVWTKTVECILQSLSKYIAKISGAERSWAVEVAHAIACERNIVPVADGFSFDSKSDWPNPSRRWQGATRSRSTLTISRRQWTCLSGR